MRLSERVQRSIKGRSLWDILGLVGKNIIYPFYRLSPSLINARRRDQQFDLKFGTDTGGTVEYKALDIPIEKIGKGYRYQPSTGGMIARQLSALEIPFDDFMFIDYGSGKGRALLHASSWPFKEVIGVEISESLHKIACKNIGIYSNPEQACEKISSHCADVTEFEPPLLPLVCYFYNPFGAEIMQKVIQRLENSYNLKKRPIWVIYISPVHKNHILERPHWYMVNEGENYCIFMLKPEVFDAET